MLFTAVSVSSFQTSLLLPFWSSRCGSDSIDWCVVHRLQFQNYYELLLNYLQWFTGSFVTLLFMKSPSYSDLSRWLYFFKSHATERDIYNFAWTNYLKIVEISSWDIWESEEFIKNFHISVNVHCLNYNNFVFDSVLEI